MKKVSIKYNPYLIATDIWIDGSEPRNNSSLKFEKQRLQEWADILPDLLVKECRDKNFQIEFKGTQTDFEDLRLAFDLRKDKICSSFIHIPTTEISQVEEEVDNIFMDIQIGPIDELKSSSISDAFHKAKNQEFEVNVIATVSAGKSTLINSLLGKRLLPARHEATTATVVKIINAEQENYSLRAFDALGNELLEYRLIDATYKKIDELNDNPDIVSIEIKGRIPFVNTVGMQLVLVDTPGPNNARNKNHEKLTYEMLKDSEKSLVLYILNGEQLGVNDNEKLLDYVCKCMKEGGKQSRDRYLFVVNKLDVWDLDESNRIERKLTEELQNLESRGIINPCLFPVSSLAALELRTGTKDIQSLNTFKYRSGESTSYHFDNYYNFNHLPTVVGNRLKSILIEGDPDREIEIHSGIISLEQAISLYVNKYARTTKIKDLVDSFNYTLSEFATIENLKKTIREDKEKRVKIQGQISSIRTNLSIAKQAQTCTNVINSLNLTTGLTKIVEDSTKDVLSTINTIISNNNETRVELSNAKQACEIIDKEFNSKILQLEVEIDAIIRKAYDDAILKIINEYTKHLKQLNISARPDDYHFEPLSLVSAELQKLKGADYLIDDYKSAPEDEGRYITVHKKKKVEGTRGESAAVGGVVGAGIGAIAFALDLCGGCGLFTALAAGAGIVGGAGALCGEGSHEIDVEEQEWESKMVTYVNMSDLVGQYFQPIQKFLLALPKKVLDHVTAETSKIQINLSKKLEDINNLIDKKLEELSSSVNAERQTSEEIDNNEIKVKWLEGIQKRINELIMF